MTGRTHDLAALAALGIAVIIVVPQHVTLATLLAAIFANQLGGIAPDIDQPTAPLWRNLPVGGVIGRVFDKALGGHRFLSHSIVGVALFGVLAQLLLRFLAPIMPHINVQYVWWAFMIGVASHLVMDSLTKEGVPWLLPLPHKFGLPPVRQLRITTGSKAETLLIVPALVGLLIWLASSHYQLLLKLASH